VTGLTTLGNASTTVLSVSGSLSASGIVSNGIIESTSGGVKFPDGTTQITATSGSNTGATNAEMEQRTSIATWGDSLTGQDDFVTERTSYPSYLSNLTGYDVINGGIGGETSVQIKDRMIAATDKYGYPTIILAGWNDINSLNNSAAITQVKASIASMVAALTTDKYIIISVYTGNNLSLYANIIQLNQDLATIYGSHFVDVRSYLVTKYDPASPQDVSDHNLDIIPASLRADSVHLNPAGNKYAADKIFENIAILGFPNTVSLTPDNWRYLFKDGLTQSSHRVLNVSPVNDNIHLGLNTAIHMTNSTTGNKNIIIGTEAMDAATTSSNNVAIGYRSMWFMAGDGGTNNIGIGSYSLRGNAVGGYNTAIGDYTLRNTTASYNTTIGASAGRTNSTGTYNTFLGYYAGYNGSQLATATNSTAVGNGAYTTASNQVVLGNSSVLNTVLRGSVNIESKTTMPSTCSVGDTITDGDGTVGLCLCTATNTWSGLTSSAGVPDCN
jgi:lysophospholipase L1-like esterase